MAFANGFLSVGGVIIDDIVLPDGRVRMGQLGGGSTHAAMGMRVWSEPVGLVALVGEDFPQELKAEMDKRLDTQGLVQRPRRSVRAWQLYEEDGSRSELMRTGFEAFAGMELQPGDLPQAYRNARGVHLHVSPQDAPAWIQALRGADTLILWEPPITWCTPENRPALRRVNALVDVVSPNLKEGRTITGQQEPAAVLDALLEDGARVAALRMGAEGSLVASADGTRLHVPALRAGPLVDATGAGNAYCGGFLVGLAETGDPAQAGCYAAVSASFALEQFGALFDLQGIRQRAEQRLAGCRPEAL